MLQLNLLQTREHYRRGQREKKGTHDTPCLEVINSNPEAPAFLSPFILSPTKLGADCAEGHKNREARRTVRQTQGFSY